MKIPFTKMHGIGNNYIYIDAITHEFDDSIFNQLAINVSNVNTGIGSDGLIVIHRSDVADVGMRIFNKDGSEGQSCGNGLRCTAKYAYENHLVSTNVFRIETKAAIVTVEVYGDRECIDNVTVDLGSPFLNRSQIPMHGPDDNQVIAEEFHVAAHSLQVTALFLGNPNAVFFVDAIEEAPLHELGAIVTEDPRFPDRVNVGFVEIISSNEMNYRVWERGSGVTEACGTGASAAVVAAILNGYIGKGIDVKVHLSGGDLCIKWAGDDHVWMTGPAETTIQGVFHWKRRE
ncbi:diaminopimelate epimerase [Sporosarcina luteola]|uniref:diaminopimelate epimerase n=1 Tax=Sporosarcina luteola TaxID=582850 RepID=UPI00203F351B|nr:diaminopimelate epimerase [Sporosarcina luteola]MCM3638920.1 diaminopimelate epimerase [Sporosarcina luteola]